MVDLTFPQPGDLPDAAYFAFATGRARSGIISGLTFTTDFTVPEVTVDPGKAVIDRGDMTTVHPNIDPPETVSDAVAVVEIESQTVALDSATLNHIFLDANVANDDSGTVVANTTGSKPTTASLKIGEVDTSTDTVSEQFNKIEDDGTLSFPDADAANAALSSLPDGVVVIDRTNGVRISNGAISVNTLEANDKINTADLSNAVQDEVLKKDASGTGLKFDTVSTEPNAPNWQEDTNSPFTASGASSLSGTISDTGYDEYLFRIEEIEGSTASPGAWELTINGNTGGYNYVDNADSRTTSASVIELYSGVSGVVAFTGEILASVREFNVHFDFGIASEDARTGVVDTGISPSSTGLDSFAFDHTQDNDISGTVEVFRRDIG